MLNQKLNNAKDIFFIGIGGISMSALAMILAKKGYNVKGYDRSASDETECLQKAGIPVSFSFEESHIEEAQLVVYTAAVNETHPLIKRAAERGIPLMPRAKLLDAISSEYKNSMGVSGTHGKSTTSGLLSYIFECSSETNGTYLVGAKLPFLDAAYKIGSDENFIFEADEYKNSFLNFNPKMVIILNIELDHVDFYKNIENVIKSFSQYIKKADTAVINFDCENAKKAIKGFEGKVYSYSVKDKTACYYADKIAENHGFYSFDIYFKGEFLIKAELSIPGIHNVSNALAACAAAHISGIKLAYITTGLKGFRGVSRRFELVAEINGGQVFDDYAHHPDEVAASIKAARQVAENRVIAVYQPHTYSRLKYFYSDFIKALSQADKVIITDVYSAREAPDPLVNSQKLAAEIKNADFISDFDDIVNIIKDTIKPGDVMILLTAGDLHNITKKLSD